MNNNLPKRDGRYNPSNKIEKNTLVHKSKTRNIIGLSLLGSVVLVGGTVFILNSQPKEKIQSAEKPNSPNGSLTVPAATEKPTVTIISLTNTPSGSPSITATPGRFPTPTKIESTPKPNPIDSIKIIDEMPKTNKIDSIVGENFKKIIEQKNINEKRETGAFALLLNRGAQQDIAILEIPLNQFNSVIDYKKKFSEANPDFPQTQVQADTTIVLYYPVVYDFEKNLGNATYSVVEAGSEATILDLLKEADKAYNGQKITNISILSNYIDKINPNFKNIIPGDLNGKYNSVFKQFLVDQIIGIHNDNLGNGSGLKLSQRQKIEIIGQELAVMSTNYFNDPAYPDRNFNTLNARLNLLKAELAVIKINSSANNIFSKLITSASQKLTELSDALKNLGNKLKS